MVTKVSASRPGAPELVPPKLRERAWILVAILAAVGSWLYTGRNLPLDLHSGDAFQYSIVARRLAAGEGFTTGIVFPAELDFGVTADHPSVVRPPLWPLALAAVFTVTGPEAWAVHALVLAFFVATVLAAGALAARLAGPGIAALTAAAVAASPQLAVYTFDGLTEIPLAFCVTLVFLLCARGGHPLTLGVACGCAYLMRYNGIVLAVLVVPLLYLAERRLRPLLAFAAGFAAVAAPWWIRNFVVAGDPFFSLYNLTLWFAPVTKPRFSLNYMIDPDLTSAVAMHPLRKLGIQLPQLLARFPLASANLAACAGVILACVRGQRLHVGFLGVAAAMTLLSALVLARGRYFAPFVPALVALGAAGWTAHGGRVRRAGLALVLLAPLLPSWPAPLADVKLLRAAIEVERSRDGDDSRNLDPALARCLAGRPVVLAEDAERLTWETDAISIKLPGQPAVFWRIVDEFPVQYLQIRHWANVSREQIETRFEPRPACGPGLYRRRDS